MPTKMSIAVLCLAAGGCFATAAAQTIYRCGDSYGQQPCPGGTQVQAGDARSASQTSHAGVAARRDAKAADAMEKARLKEEAKPAQAYIPPARAQDAVDADGRSAAKDKAAKPAVFRATSPAKPGDAKTNKKKANKKKANRHAA